MGARQFPQFVNIETTEEFQLNALLTELAFVLFDDTTNAWCKSQHDFLTALAQKTQAIPPDFLYMPDTALLGPIFETARFAGDPAVRDLLTGLAAACCHAELADSVLPSFAVIASQLSPVDIEILRSYRLKMSVNMMEHRQEGEMVSLTPTDAPVMIRQTYPIVNYVLYTAKGERYTVAVDVYGEVPALTDVDLISKSIGNLSRLGLVTVTFLESMYDDALYEKFEQNEFCRQLRRFALGHGLGDARLQIGSHTVITGGYQRLEIEKGCTRLTEFGMTFVDVCMMEGGHDPQG